uniref:HAT C-terminal dimerisation domain-containing protein n=1 Tax=Ditylenchus dipsaci TaxID=166011 RepID=A0A915DUI1_9BILA
MKSLLANKFENLQDTIKVFLSKLLHRFSLTCDIWTDSGLKNAYLGVTLHFVDAEANLRRVFLGLRQLNGSHTSSLIRRETEKLLQEYGLTFSSAFKVVTDGGSNVVKGFNDDRSVILTIVDEEEMEEDEIQEDVESDYERLDLLIRQIFSNSLLTDSRHIAMLAMEVLAIPATSAPIEKVFSQAGMANCKHRNRTEFELLNLQLIVYCNLYVDDL